MVRKFGVIIFLLIAAGIISFYLNLARSRSQSIESPRGSLFAEEEEVNSDLLRFLTLEHIFSASHYWVDDIPPNEKITLIATGDIIPARAVNFETVTQKNFLWPYEKTADFVKNADLTFVNLETPLFSGCPLTQTGMIFCGDARNVEGLVYAGVDIASLANNHAGNHGDLKVAETVRVLQQNNIEVTGISGPLYKTIKGIRFAFLGYNDITKPQPGIVNADPELIKREIGEARQQADVVIVTYHWGVEYRAQPDDDQKRLGRLSIDAGADLVIGNHPHWIQPIEIYKGKLITYAHGNYIFDQMWSQKTREGVIGKYTFYKKHLVDVEYFPLQIENYGQPFFLSGEAKKRILDDMKLESNILSQDTGK